jgi:hypothetical protein
MPTVQGIPGPYRCYFYSYDCHEPRHVHVRRERMTCKFWLDPIELANNHGFRDRELSQIRVIIDRNLSSIQEAWNEHCR